MDGQDLLGGWIGSAVPIGLSALHYISAILSPFALLFLGFGARFLWDQVVGDRRRVTMQMRHGRPALQISTDVEPQDLEKMIEILEEKLSPNVAAGKAAPSAHSAPDDLGALIDRAIMAITPGRFAFDPPSEMRQGKTQRVTVALIRSRDLDDALRPYLSSSRVTELSDIPTSPLMSVALRGDPAFVVTALSDAEQAVGSQQPTAWQFDVQALRQGSHRLTVCASLRLPLQGREDLRKSVDVLERTIIVRVAPLYVGRTVLQHYWQWLIVTIIALLAAGGGFTAWLKLLHK